MKFLILMPLKKKINVNCTLFRKNYVIPKRIVASEDSRILFTTSMRE